MPSEICTDSNRENKREGERDKRESESVRKRGGTHDWSKEALRVGSSTGLAALGLKTL